MPNEVMTVLGPLPATELGITLMHEHVYIDLCRVTRDPDHWLYDSDLILQEVSRFSTLGGATLVDMTNRDLGRNPSGLQMVSRTTGLNIITGCGWYREPFYRQEVYEKTTNQLAEDIVWEITNGIEGTDVRPGIIGEIGSDRNYISPAEERSFRAAARAHQRSGLTISTHCVRSPTGLEQLNLLEDEGVDLRRVIIGHCDTYPDPNYHEAVARRGAYVQFDTIRNRALFDIEQRIRFTRLMVNKGYLHQLLLSQDVCMKSHLHTYGGNGYAFVLEDFVPRLLKAGLSQAQIDVILLENPIAALTGTRP